MKWEYKTDDLDTNRLNELGKEGWEVVGVFTEPQPNEYDRREVQWYKHMVLLKRLWNDPNKPVIPYYGGSRP